jgi:hypothetical protein
MILVSDMVGVLLPGRYAHHISPFSRIFNANYTYITRLVLLIWGLMMGKGFVKRIYPSYCLAIEVAIIIGLIHYMCIKLGYGFMPILRQDGSFNKEAMAEVSGHIFTRIYGVSGEPKSLGFLICPYLIISVITWGKNLYRVNKWYHILMLLLGTFVLINTFSSAVLINFALIIPILLLLVPLPKFTYKGGIIIACLCICFTLWQLKDEMNLYRKSDVNFIEILYGRSFGRADKELNHGRQESVILKHFVEEPNVINGLFGWGVSQYTFHVPNQTIGSALIPVQSGLVLTLVDFGLLGMIYLVALWGLFIRLLKASILQENVYAMGFTAATISSFVGSLTFGSITSCFMYLLMALYAYCDDYDE